MASSHDKVATGTGELVQVDRRLYALPGVWENPYLVAQHRFSHGIFGSSVVHAGEDQAASLPGSAS